ncbi:hypothetical protein AB4039_20430 [Streptomyces sp. M-16]|uniref:hypothetical protein n=1 Tax=Streptomyces sp. M-16 TaxID=3233040 RepID=UPI003F96D925
MGFADAEETVAAPGLRTAVEFYSGKVELVLARINELEGELAALRADAEKFTTARDQLSAALAEILADGPPPTGEVDGAPQATSAEPPSGDGPPPRRPAARRRRSGSQPRRSPSGELMETVERILLTTGRPMPVRDITEALGRPTQGKEGRGPLATVRATCKRLVKNGRAVEQSVGMFAIARAETSPPEGAA